jgi:polyphosphate kinase
MARNFYRRIEVVFPVEQDDLRDRLINEILGAYLKDNTRAKLLRANGSYRKPPTGKNEEPFSAQAFFTEKANQLTRAAETLQEVEL